MDSQIKKIVQYIGLSHVVMIYNTLITKIQNYIDQ